MRARIKLVVQQFLARANWDVHRGVPLAIHRRAVLRRLGGVSVLDVGANVGQYALALRDAGFDGQIYSFEPLPKAFAALATKAQTDPAWTVVNAACSDSSGMSSIHESENSVSSSLLMMTQTHQSAAPESRYVGTEIPCEMIMVDDFVAAHAPAGRFHLKLDVQGFEDRVLRGARATLARVDSIETEVSFTGLYDEQAGWHELIGSLLDGFELVDVRPGFRAKDHRLLQADVLLLRRGL